MILSNLTTPLLGLVDTAVMGHQASPNYLGAVALGSLIFSFLYWGFGFLRMGTTGITAQALGNRDSNEIRAILGRAMGIASLIAISIVLLSPLAASLAFQLFKADVAVENLAYRYFEIRIFSAPATLMNYVLLGWFIGMHNSRVPLFITLVANLVNIVLDWYLGIYLHWRIEGIAWASVAAEYIALITGLFFCRNLLAQHHGYWQLYKILDRAAFFRMCSLNSHIFIRTLCLISVFAIFTQQGARLGETVLAANALLLNFQTFMAFALDGFAHAAEALVGKAYGAKDFAALKKDLKAATHWSLLVAMLFSVVYALFGSNIVDQLTNIENVRAEASSCLIWMVVTPLISVWSYLYDGIFIGSTRTREMRNGMLIAFFLCYLPAIWIFSSIGVHGLWLSFMLFMVVRGALLVKWFHRASPFSTSSQII